MASADLESSSEMAKGSLFPHRMEGAGEPSGVSFITTLKVKVTVVPPTLCDPMGYTVRGILQALLTLIFTAVFLEISILLPALQFIYS